MSSVLLGDLNDFIAPSQACVNPLFSSNEAQDEGEGASRRGVVSLRLEDDHDVVGNQFLLTSSNGTVPGSAKPNLILPAGGRGAVGSVKAIVSLNDCLACSGCVTSAETVLISQQSNDRFRKVLREVGEETRVIVTVSPQSRAALAERFGVSVASAQAKISVFLQNLGVSLVLDEAVSGDISLIEAREEFVQRFRAAFASPKPRAGGGERHGWVRPAPTTALSAKEQLHLDGTKERLQYSNDAGPLPLPMLISACPGWVCYAEKTNAEAIPYMSTVKSPQQVMGTIVKRLLPDKVWGAANSKKIVHVTIMPCFDKKLEASRKDFLHEDDEDHDDLSHSASTWAEVDLVLTSTELLKLMEEEAQASKASVEEYFSSLSSEDCSLAQFHRLGMESMETSSADGRFLMYNVAAESVGSTGGSSGGYIDHIFRYAARSLYGIDLDRGELNYVRRRNSDFYELTLEPGVKDTGLPPLRFALAYGFRNIQSIISQLKRDTCKYHLVEVMACPGGCINGGGQLKNGNEAPDQMRQRVAEVDRRLRIGSKLRGPDESPFARQVYDSMIKGAPLSLRAKEHFHTTYHAVPPMEEVAPPLVSW